MHDCNEECQHWKPGFDLLSDDLNFHFLFPFRLNFNWILELLALFHNFPFSLLVMTHHWFSLAHPSRKKQFSHTSRDGEARGKWSFIKCFSFFSCSACCLYLIHAFRVPTLLFFFNSNTHSFPIENGSPMDFRFQQHKKIFVWGEPARSSKLEITSALTHTYARGSREFFVLRQERIFWSATYYVITFVTDSHSLKCSRTSSEKKELHRFESQLPIHLVNSRVVISFRLLQKLKLS